MFAKNVFVLGIFLLAAQGALAEEGRPLLTVKAAEFTSAVSPNKMYTRVLSGQARADSLFLWTLIEGDKEALKILEKEGKLPILHVWKRYVADIPYSEMVEPENEHHIPLPVGERGDLGDLKLELDLRRDHFDWRTWSTPTTMKAGRWIVDVTYADREAIKCGDMPCRYEIVLKK